LYAGHGRSLPGSRPTLYGRQFYAVTDGIAYSKPDSKPDAKPDGKPAAERRVHDRRLSGAGPT